MRVRKVTQPKLIHDTLNGVVGFAMWSTEDYLGTQREWRWTYYLALSVVYELGMMARAGLFNIKADAPPAAYYEEYEV